MLIDTIAKSKHDCLALWAINRIGVPCLKVDNNELDRLWHAYQAVASITGMQLVEVDIVVAPKPLPVATRLG